MADERSREDIVKDTLFKARMAVGMALIATADMSPFTVKRGQITKFASGEAYDEFRRLDFVFTLDASDPEDTEGEYTANGVYALSSVYYHDDGTVRIKAATGEIIDGCSVLCGEKLHIRHPDLIVA